jgi:hypothetical protein
MKILLSTLSAVLLVLPFVVEAKEIKIGIDHHWNYGGGTNDELLEDVLLPEMTKELRKRGYTFQGLIPIQNGEYGDPSRIGLDAIVYAGPEGSGYYKIKFALRGAEGEYRFIRRFPLAIQPSDWNKFNEFKDEGGLDRNWEKVKNQIEGLFQSDLDQPSTQGLHRKLPNECTKSLTPM